MKKVPAASAQTHAAYAAIGEALAERGVVSSAMFGMPALKHDGKAFAGLFGDAMVFKLSGASHVEALALGGAELFDPSGMGRPMKAWVVVPPAHRKRWAGLADQALETTQAPTGKDAKGSAKTSAARIVKTGPKRAKKGA